MKSVKKYFPLCARIALGVIFVAASIDKIAHPEAFATIIHNYQILPGSLINIAAITLPWIEVFLGVALIAGFWLPGAVVLTNALLLAFFSALVYNLARGLDVHCGCFTTKITGSTHTTWYVVRDSLFLLLGLSVLPQVFRGSRVRLSARNIR